MYLPVLQIIVWCKIQKVLEILYLNAGAFRMRIGSGGS